MVSKSSVRKAIKKVGKRKPEAVVKPLKAKQTQVKKATKGGSVKRVTMPKSDQMDLKRQLKIQKALYQIADAASAVRDMPSFYKKLHKIVRKLMYAENFFIALYDEQLDLISWPYHVDEKDKDDSVWGAERLKGSKTWTAHVMRTGEIVHTIHDLEKLLKRKNVSIKAIYTPPVDGIAVPLKMEKKILGALTIQSYAPGITYTDSDVQVLTFVAQHIATSLTRARAIEAERQRTDELAILNSVGEAMVKTLDVKTVTRIVGDKVRDIFKTQFVQINLFDSQTNFISPLYFLARGKYINLKPYPLGSGLTSKIIQTGKALLLETFEQQAAHGATLPKEFIEKGISEKEITESWVGVPIISQDKVIGTVAISEYKKYAFDHNNLRLLQTLSANMGVAIENARLFEAEQERVAELQIINSI